MSCRNHSRLDTRRSSLVKTPGCGKHHPWNPAYDLTVDFDGNLHLMAEMYAGSSFHADSLNWGYFNGTAVANLFHFTFLKNEGLWLTRGVKRWLNAAAFNGGVSYRARPQAGRTPDGKKLFFTWAESEAYEFNQEPYMWAYGFDVENDKHTPPVNVYETADAPFQGLAFLPTLSPVTFGKGEGCGDFEYELPHVISFPSGGDFNPAYHIYTPGVGFDESDFTENYSLLPNAQFSFSANVLTVDFHDQSTGYPIAWNWDFGDGATSAAQNPSHTYAMSGTYTVCLTVTNAFGQGQPFCQILSVPIAIVPAFGFNAVGLAVEFADQSQGSPNSWIWDFGDGSTSSEQNPSHVYASFGTYEVCLTVANAVGSNGQICQSLVLVYPPVANFSYVSNGTSLSFQDLSTNTPTSWFWSFGDGSTSTLQHPAHSFAAAGVYEVCLTASNLVGINTYCQNIVVGTLPVADFSFQSNGYTVSFSDLSTQLPTDWLWDFGDGSPFSSVQNPAHTYAAAGSYTVCLVASNALGSSAATCKEVTVVVVPVAAFDFSTIALEASFSDASTNQPTSWAWDFGDGQNSQVQNPVHVYATSGTYSVCLTVGNIAGSNQVCKDVAVLASSTQITYGVGQVVVFPNPAFEKIWIISLDKPLPNHAKLLVFNAIGQRSDVVVVESSNGLEVSLDGLPNGNFHFVIMENDQTIAQGSFVKAEN